MSEQVELLDGRTPALNKALAAVQTRLPKIGKGEEGKVTGTTKDGKPYSYTYKYADLSDISPIVLPLLGEEGLSWMCRPTMDDAGRFMLLYELRHESGEVVAGQYPLNRQGGPQDIGKEITYARRYALCAVTGVAPGADDDDGASAQQASRQRDFPGPTRTAPLPPQAQRGRERAEERKAPQREGESEAERDDRRRKRMFALFSEVGLNSKDEQIMFIEDVLQRALGSRAEILPEEYEKIIDELEDEKREHDLRINPDTGEVR